MIAVKVPAGAVPGDKVDAVYDGRRVSFVVPPSVRPGQSVHVPVPASDNRKGSPELQARLQKLRATSSRKLKTPSPTTPSSSPLLLFTKKTPPASPAPPEAPWARAAGARGWCHRLCQRAGQVAVWFTRRAHDNALKEP